MRRNPCGSSPNSGRSRRTIGCSPRLTQATAGHSSPSARIRSGAIRPISIATRPPIELPTTCALVDLELVHQPEHDLGEPAGVVAAAAPACTRSRSRAGRARGRDSAGSARRPSRTARRGCRRGRGGAARRGRGPSSASRCGGGRPGRRGSGAAAGGRRRAGTCPRRRPRGRGCRGRRQQPPLERVDARRTRRWRSAQPRVGVGGEGHVGPAARRALADPGGVARAAHLPGVAEVAELDVVGGVEAGIGARDSGRAASGTPARRRSRRSRDAGPPRHGGHPTDDSRPDVAAGARVAATVAKSRSACTTRAPARCGRSSRATAARVGIYACGPTVYGRIHVGNARPFVVFSLLKRVCSSTRATTSPSSRTSRTSTTRSTPPPGEPGVGRATSSRAR